MKKSIVFKLALVAFALVFSVNASAGIIDGVFLLNALINCYKPKTLDRGRGCIDFLIFTTNVLHSSWILVGIGLTEKCQLH